jgi:hypothetical protein
MTGAVRVADPYAFELLVADGAAWRRDADAMPGDARTAMPTAVRIIFRFVFIIDLIVSAEIVHMSLDGPKAAVVI